MTANDRSLLSACTLSGSGAMPLHLRSVLVAVLVSDGITSVSGAGIVGGLILLGQCIMAALLAIANVKQITRHHIIVVSAILMASLAASPFALYASWFIVGLCCGVLQFVGTLATALHPQQTYAFRVRLGFSLSLAGSTAAVLLLMPLKSYTLLLLVLALVFSLMLTTGTSLLQPMRAPPRKVGKSDSDKLKYVVLAMIFLLYVGQGGLLAYILQQGTQRGFTLTETIWALAIVKIVAGTLLLVARSQKISLWVLSIVLAVANVVVMTTTSLPLFVAGFFLLELGFNFMGARLQALTASIAPVFAGQWLVSVYLLASAIGPVLQGYALEADLPFLTFAVIAALLPITLTRKAGD